MNVPTEADRRAVALAHLAMLASLGCYGLLLWLLKEQVARAADAPRGDAMALPLAAIGIAQYALASWLGRIRLPGPADGARTRVRSYFLIRFAAAEAIGIFGLVVGFLGARPALSAALLTASAVALLATAPTREAWEAASARALSTGR